MGSPLLTRDGQIEPKKAMAPAAPTDRLKLLFLLPFAPDLRGSHGGVRATAAIVNMLSQHHRVRILFLEAADDPAPLQSPANCERLMSVPMDAPARSRSPVLRLVHAIGKFLWRRPDWVEECRSSRMASLAAAAAAEFEPDIVHIEFHVMAQYIPALRSAYPTAAIIVTEHEPGITADARPGAFLTLRERLGALTRRRAWSRYERRALRRSDAIITFTDSDATVLRRLLGPDGPPLSVIPLRLPQDAELLAPDATPITSDFLFVGNFRHPPNADAARRLVFSIFPIILREQPEATLTIVGPRPPEDVVAAASDRVTVTGWVDDPSIYLSGANVVLVPLRQGGGLRVKMLEACAAGKAIVASPLAIKGLPLVDGAEVMLAQTDEQFAQMALTLMLDPEARGRLEVASRRWWENEQDSGRWLAQYEALYSTLARLGNRSGPDPRQDIAG